MSGDTYWRWVEYYVLTEEFDRVVCAKRDERGDAVPMSWQERQLCTKNARATLDRLRLKLSDPVRQDITQSHRGLVEMFATRR